MNNWKEELKKIRLQVKDNGKILYFTLDDLFIGDKIINICDKVEQDAYKRGLEQRDKRAEIKIAGLQKAYDNLDGGIQIIEKQPFEHILEVEKIKQEGIKEGLERALVVIDYLHLTSNDVHDQAYDSGISESQHKIQQELNKL